VQVDGGAMLLAYISSGAIAHVKMTTFHNNKAMVMYPIKIEALHVIHTTSLFVYS
jgi:hypothetical protein